ncbi:MAG: tyrosine-type recombinase/integrase [Chloroflexota bacterium]|nr:tyrosine-type recombinase/integrase [Chloroflexota bacterium]
MRALTPEPTGDAWARAAYAFLAEKEKRSGSRRTVESYGRMLRDFLGRTGQPPDEITPQDVFAWAYGVGASGREPSATTVGARLASVGSFYAFLVRMDIVSSNPCDQLQRPRVEQPRSRGLSADEVRRLLRAIPDTPVGLRDRAIVVTLLLTGRRRAEVLGMSVSDVACERGVPFYAYRGKGGTRGKRELPRPAYDAIVAALAAFGKDLATMSPDEPLWPSSRGGTGVTSGVFAGNLRRYYDRAGLPRSGVHALRHSAAKLRRDAGESIENVSRFLDHSSLAVTTTYLRRLEGEEDTGWARVAEAIGLCGPPGP